MPLWMQLVLVAAVGGALATLPAAAWERAEHSAQLIFPLEALHNHASCVVELPGGDLLACWYRGSGERRADDVAVMGARLRRGARHWSAPFVLADVPGFPDCNPCLLVDPRGRLWLFWVTIQANEWHTALLKYRRADRPGARGVPRWSAEGVLHLKPGEEFARLVAASVERDLAALERFPEEARPRLRDYLEARRRHAADRYYQRLGWMPRAHPVALDERRLLLPLYSDGFDFSLMALSDDLGDTWRVSEPLVSAGGVQPTVARRRDGSLVAYFRNNGPPPRRLLRAESHDGGATWSPVEATSLPNPGSGAEVVALRSGLWALIYNDTERGRHSLAVSLSEDEGATWKWTRHLERDLRPRARHAAYPSLVEGADGVLHATYTWTLPEEEARRDSAGRPLRESIKYARFTVEWVRQGGRRPDRGAVYPASMAPRSNSRLRGMPVSGCSRPSNSREIQPWYPAARSSPKMRG